MEFNRWREYRIGEVCDIRSSKRIFLKDYVSEGIPFYRSKEIILKHKNEKIKDTLYISKEKFIEIKEKYGVPQKNDILLTSVGTLGIPYLVKDKEEFYFKDGNLTWFNNFTSAIDPNFLYYWLVSPMGKQELDAITIGSTQKALTMVSLKKIKIKIPLLTSQKKIVQILSSLDESIFNNNEIISNFEGIAQALFQHWFVDYEFPNEDGEPYKSSGGKMIQNEIGDIPKEWKPGTLNDLGQIIGGGTPSKKIDEYYTKNEISWITPKDLSNDKSIYIYKGAIDITEEALKKSSANLLPKNTVLFSSRAPIGYIAIAGKNVATNQGFKSIVPAQNIPTEYIYMLLKHLTPSIEANAGGSTFKEISGSGMKGIKTVLPPSALLLNYKETVKSLFEKIKFLEKENKILIDLRNTLLPKLLSGEVELSDETEVTENVPIQ